MRLNLFWFMFISHMLTLRPVLLPIYFAQRERRWWKGGGMPVEHPGPALRLNAQSSPWAAHCPPQGRFPPLVVFTLRAYFPPITVSGESPAVRPLSWSLALSLNLWTKCETQWHPYHPCLCWKYSSYRVNWHHSWTAAAIIVTLGTATVFSNCL